MIRAAKPESYRWTVIEVWDDDEIDQTSFTSRKEAKDYIRERPHRSPFSANRITEWKLFRVDYALVETGHYAVEEPQ